MKTESAFRRLILAALACAAVCGAARADNETRDVNSLMFSGEGLPPVAPEEMALAEVPFAKGAPAVGPRHHPREIGDDPPVAEDDLVGLAGCPVLQHLAHVGHVGHRIGHELQHVLLEHHVAHADH